MTITRWHDEIVHPKLLLELQDMAALFSQINDLRFSFSYGAFVDVKTRILHASTIWDDTEKRTRQAGYKTDIFLRALGTIHHSDALTIQSFSANVSAQPFPSFASQLLTLLEDIRLQTIIVLQRPGTEKELHIGQHFSPSIFKDDYEPQ